MNLYVTDLHGTITAARLRLTLLTPPIKAAAPTLRPFRVALTSGSLREGTTRQTTLAVGRLEISGLLT